MKGSESWRSFVLPVIGLFLVLLDVICVSYQDYCRIRPAASVVIAGSRLSLNCTPGNNVTRFLRWALEEVVQSEHEGSTRTKLKILVNSKAEVIVDGYSVSNDSDTSSLILELNNLTLDQGGTHRCSYLVGKIRRYCAANVTVIANDLRFKHGSDPSPGNKTTVQCQLSYRGSFEAPCSIYIYNVRGTFVNTTQTHLSRARNSVDSWFTFTADFDEDLNTHWCTAEVYMNNGSSTNPVVSLQAEVSIRWAPVTLVKVVPARKEDCLEDSCGVKSLLRCSAVDGNPKPKAFVWEREEKDSWVHVGRDVEMITLDEEGRFKYRCTAKNMVRDFEHTATSPEFSVKVTATADSVKLYNPVALSKASSGSFFAYIIICAILFECRKYY